MFQLLLVIFLLTMPMATVFVLPRIPWWLARALAIPLGKPKLAWQLSRLAPSVWKSDSQGGPLLSGAWALLYQKTPDPDFIRTLETRLSAATQIGAATIVASALLRAYRRNFAEARELLESVETFERKIVPRFMQKLASDCLMADALFHGEWERAYELGMRARVRSRSLRLLTAIAVRLLKKPSPNNTLLRWMWCFAPRRRQTWPLLVHALTNPANFSICSTKSASILDKTPLQQALMLHQICYQAAWQRARDPERLHSLCEAWHHCFQQASFEVHVAERARALGVKTAVPIVIEQFKRTICQQIATLAQRAHIAFDPEQNPDNEIIQLVSRMMREHLLAQIEQTCERLGQRVETGRKLPANEEWRAWIHLRDMCEQAGRLGGLELRRLIFPQVHRQACEFAVWLWNRREEYNLAMPMFRWLLAEAQALGDEAAIELQTKNIAAGG